MRADENGTDLVPGATGEVHGEQLDGLERRGRAWPDLVDHQLQQKPANEMCQRVSNVATYRGAAPRRARGQLDIRTRVMRPYIGRGR